jgi:hypothetical protein
VELFNVQVEVPEPEEMVDGLQTTESPVEGEVEVEMLTVPVKPFVGETFAVKEPDDPEAKLMLD